MTYSILRNILKTITSCQEFPGVFQENNRKQSFTLDQTGEDRCNFTVIFLVNYVKKQQLCAEIDQVAVLFNSVCVAEDFCQRIWDK